MKSTILEELEKLRIKHYQRFSDSSHSCPMSEYGCDDDDVAMECNCGADDHNARIDQLISLINACHISKPGLPCHEPYNPHK